MSCGCQGCWALPTAAPIGTPVSVLISNSNLDSCPRRSPHHPADGLLLFKQIVNQESQLGFIQCYTGSRVLTTMSRFVVRNDKIHQGNKKSAINVNDELPNSFFIELNETILNFTGEVTFSLAFVGLQDYANLLDGLPWNLGLGKNPFNSSEDPRVLSLTLHSFNIFVHFSVSRSWWKQSEDRY